MPAVFLVPGADFFLHIEGEGLAQTPEQEHGEQHGDDGSEDAGKHPVDSGEAQEPPYEGEERQTHGGVQQYRAHDSSVEDPRYNLRHASRDFTPSDRGANRICPR